MSLTVIVIPRECCVSEKDVATLRRKGAAVIVADNAHLVKVLDTASVVSADGVLFEAALRAVATSDQYTTNMRAQFAKDVTRLALAKLNESPPEPHPMTAGRHRCERNP